jgi:outer membrane PBP1 activator LpoA protein
LAEFQNLWPFPITIARFDEIKQVTSAVGGSMGVADSVARKTELTQLFDQEMQFLPRARQDLDAVVALTSNVESRALVPALRFHFANNLPVYATSQSIRGGSNIRELAGFTVTELPILANPSLNMRNLVSTYALTSSPLVELYALGYDAYQLATWIHLLNQSEKTSTQRTLRLSMATGIIQLSPNGRFQRTLDLVNIDRRGRLQEIKKSL